MQHPVIGYDAPLPIQKPYSVHLSQLLAFSLGSVLLVDCKQTLRETERLVTFVQTNNLEWSKLCLSPDWSWYFTLSLGNIILTVEVIQQCAEVIQQCTYVRQS